MSRIGIAIQVSRLNSGKSYHMNQISFFEDIDGMEMHGMKMCSKMNIQSNIKILKVGANKSSESAAFLFNKKAF
ncbi:hypothetical protein ACFQ9T_28935 [Bacillus cereus]|uniref:hypothetical protein n=2 Tax=Bacillus cereus TaxID=1396 RepID=UPI003671EB99